MKTNPTNKLKKELDDLYNQLSNIEKLLIGHSHAIDLKGIVSKIIDIEIELEQRSNI